jgi:hypothetical protein
MDQVGGARAGGAPAGRPPFHATPPWQPPRRRRARSWVARPAAHPTPLPCPRAPAPPLQVLELRKRTAALPDEYLVTFVGERAAAAAPGRRAPRPARPPQHAAGSACARPGGCLLTRPHCRPHCAAPAPQAT